MDANALLRDMLIIWSWVNFESPKAQTILSRVKPTSDGAICSEVLKFTTEEDVSARKAWMTSYSKPNAKGAFCFETWQVQAALMTEGQVEKLARHAGAIV